MQRAAATIRNGRVELMEPIDWAEGTPVEVVAFPRAPARADWFSLPPLDAGKYTPPDDEDILGEMLDDSRD